MRFNMARKLRLEFPGACYHVINRGNYRHDVFRDDRTKAAFEVCLFAACRKSGLLLHAFVIMRNHYHLALETPAGNLVAGMQWLQATFANRFNRLRGERGHLFQGRYKALLVEAGNALGMVCHYIHLNPVRAGVCAVADLRRYRRSSYSYLWTPRSRPEFLNPGAALAAAGGLPDTTSGRLNYAAFLEWQSSDGPAGRSKAYVNLSRGWALGGVEFKQGLLRDHVDAVYTRAWEEVGARAMREMQWAQALRKILPAARRPETDLARAPKSAPWKLALASWMKTHTQASNPWLCAQMNLGAPAAFSRNLTLYRRNHPTEQPLLQLPTSSSAT